MEMYLLICCCCFFLPYYTIYHRYTINYITVLLHKKQELLLSPDNLHIKRHKLEVMSEYIVSFWFKCFGQIFWKVFLMYPWSHPCYTCPHFYLRHPQKTNSHHFLFKWSKNCLCSPTWWKPLMQKINVKSLTFDAKFGVSSKLENNQH